MRELDSESECRSWGSALLGTQEPLITASIEGHPVKLLVNTGAEISVLKPLTGAVRNEKMSVLVAAGTVKDYYLTPERMVSLSHKQVTQSLWLCQIALFHLQA